MCLLISKNTHFHSLAIANQVLEWCRGYPEVRFKGRMILTKYTEMWKFHRFLETLVFYQLASFRRCVF